MNAILSKGFNESDHDEVLEKPAFKTLKLPDAWLAECLEQCKDDPFEPIVGGFHDDRDRFLRNLAQEHAEDARREAWELGIE